jgi:hypothetical protein
MATNAKWNGFLLGAGFGALGLWAIKGAQNMADPNLANTIYGWFISWGQSIADAIPQLSGITAVYYAFAIAILVGGLIGLYTEMK